MNEQSLNIRSAFTILETVLPLLLVAVIFIAIALPRPVSDGRGDYKTRICINNLRQIDAAASQYAL
jgi:hypothetical protein